MVDDKEIIEDAENVEREEIFSKAVRAGKRTYFFDVKATRRNDYYLTVTESKKRFNKDGRFFYEKHKVFLYKEDFEKFLEGLEESIEFIKANQPLEEMPTEQPVEDTHKEEANAYTDIDFEDLEVGVVASEESNEK
ncbi:MAG: PUR family DNA/RNA-binding protein [Bacteroidales bacterium]|nr:PUR family DNA/RNA-binding protein [Bacteroidales bacterium]MBN2819668.1 PUR family DNA/RNA-binding protein [Bacteroidales bacterium]